jgi:hypothetical protein
MSRREPWAVDFAALKSVTERGRPPLALPDDSTKETLMMRLSRRPLLALGILLALLLVSGAAYAVVTESWKFFLDADQSDEAMDRQVKERARELGARAEVDVRHEEASGDVHVGMTWSNLKDILADCHDSHGEVRPYELTVTKRGSARTTTLDEDKHARLMAVLREADALSDSLEGRKDETECQRQVLSLLEERFRALGIELPAGVGDDPAARIAALVQGVNAWFGPDAPFEFHLARHPR